MTFKYISLSANSESHLYEARKKILTIAKAHDIYIKVRLCELDQFALTAVAHEISEAIKLKNIEYQQHAKITEDLEKNHAIYLNRSRKAGESNRNDTPVQVESIGSLDRKSEFEAKVGPKNLSQIKVNENVFTPTENSSLAKAHLTGQNCTLFAYSTRNNDANNPAPEGVTKLEGLKLLHLRDMTHPDSQEKYKATLKQFMTNHNVSFILNKPEVLNIEPWSNIREKDAINAYACNYITNKQHQQLILKLQSSCESPHDPNIKIDSVHVDDPDKKTTLIEHYRRKGAFD